MCPRRFRLDKLNGPVLQDHLSNPSAPQQRARLVSAVGIPQKGKNRGGFGSGAKDGGRWNYLRLRHTDDGSEKPLCRDSDQRRFQGTAFTDSHGLPTRDQSRGIFPGLLTGYWRLFGIVEDSGTGEAKDNTLCLTNGA